MDNNGLHGLTLGSLFDGIAGFPFAAVLSGITPVWAAEVEPFCVAIARDRFPNMIHYGDVSKINGADLPPVDIISFDQNNLRNEESDKWTISNFHYLGKRRRSVYK